MVEPVQGFCLAQEGYGQALAGCRDDELGDNLCAREDCREGNLGSAEEVVPGTPPAAGITDHPWETEKLAATNA